MPFTIQFMMPLTMHLKNSVSADGVHTPQLDVDVEDLADKIDKTFKLSKATYRNVKSLTED